MAKNVKETSIEAYARLPLSHQQRVVFNALLELEESCIADVAKYLGWERSTVAGRMFELREKELLEFAGKKRSRTTGVKAEMWRVFVRERS